MKILNQSRVVVFSKILGILGSGLLVIPYLPNQEAVAFLTANAAGVSQHPTDSEKLPETTEPSPDYFTPITQKEQRLDSDQENNPSAHQKIEQPLDYTEENDPLEQVTSVSQLSDVKPTDWAFEALRSLVERYGCISGYPDGRYRGNRAMTRYEFAAGLNGCLEKITQLIDTSSADFVTKEDLATLQRLQEEFATELTSIQQRVDTLEARTSTLEANQFSTTTKLNGEVVFALASSLNEKEVIAPRTTFGDEATLSYRAQLNFDTSFTGKDLLRIALSTGNVQGDTGMAFLNYGEYTDNDLAVRDLWYTFPVGDRLRFIVGANDTSFDDFAQAYSLNFALVSTGALTFFGAYNFVVYPYSADQLFAGNIKFSDSVSVDVGYFTNQPNLSTEDNGLFNGDFGVSTQLNLKPSETWSLGLTYTYTFQPGKDVTLTDTIGSPIADNPFGEATAAHRFGVMTNWNITPKINIGGWLGYIDAQAKSGLREGDNADIFTWAATLALFDIGKPGSVVGLIVGMPPKATRVEGGQKDRDTSILVEAHYRYPLSERILITPGFFVIFNPDHDNRNDDIWVGIIRTTFTF
jgi:hypothetical protein